MSMREAMDNFLNTFLSSSWSDMNESANRSWLGTIDSQTDNLLADSMESFQVDGKNSVMPVMASSHVMANVSAEDLTLAHENTSSIFSDGSLKYGISKGLYQGTTEANLQLPSFSGGSQMTFSKITGMHTNPQSEGTTLMHQLGHSSNIHQQMTQSNAVGCNVSSKPRVRARRGQATDPHSIAERLRREKIAERMKNLQGLVPNSNKTDKASMLDEIIDYVKFLQLQVKVLSMSRLGAAGAVVPLITDVQAEDIGSLHLSPIGQGIDILESQENLAFEQEVVKLMESSVTTAMQYLQNKGLCLMPIALATAISNQKGSIASILSDRKNQDLSERNDHNGDEVNLCCGIIAKQEEELTNPMGDGR